MKRTFIVIGESPKSVDKYYIVCTPHRLEDGSAYYVLDFHHGKGFFSSSQVAQTAIAAITLAQDAMRNQRHKRDIRWEFAVPLQTDEEKKEEE